MIALDQSVEYSATDILMYDAFLFQM